MRPLLPALLVSAALVSGCGGDDEAPSTPARTGGSDEQQIRQTFENYNKALVDREFGTACELITPSTIDKLKANVKTLSKDAPQECEEMYEFLYEQTDKDETTKNQLADIAKSAKIKTVKVKGDQATVDWSATVGGQEVPISQLAKKIDGTWKLEDTSN